MNLYELTGAYQELLYMLQDENCDQQMVIDTLESLDGAIEDKADNYAKIIKTLEGESDIINNELTRLAAMKKSRENNIKILKNNLENAMKVTGKTKFKTDLFSFSIAKNGGKAPLKINIPIDEIPNEYFKHTEKELNNDLIRKDLDEGKITFATYEERGESLRIR